MDSVNMNDLPYGPSHEKPRYSHIGEGIVLVEGSVEDVKETVKNIKKVMTTAMDEFFEERNANVKKKASDSCNTAIERIN